MIHSNCITFIYAIYNDIILILCTSYVLTLMNNVCSDRNFIQKEYVELKKSNPRLPILIRESARADPSITARYDYGVEKHITLYNSNENDIVSKIQELIEYSESLPKHNDTLPPQHKQVTQ